MILQWTQDGKNNQRPARSASRALPLAVALLIIAIFVLDTITSLEIAVAVFYVAVVLLSVSFVQRHGVILIAGCCIALTGLSYWLSPSGDVEAGLANSFISATAIGVTSYLALRIQSIQRAADDARAQLAHISRVTILGELTASIAHEVNQPLGAIATNGSAALRWLEAQPPNIAEARQTVTYVVEDANRASQVISRLRQLVRRAPSERALVDVNAAIQEIVDLMDHEFRRNRISVHFLSDTVPAIRGDRVQLQQVLLNLLLNAMDAINAANDQTRHITIRTGAPDPRNVMISVGDSGVGVDTGRVEMLFDAFYSTKPQGLGIGLAISRSIVELHGGRIQIGSDTPRGALVTVTLPAARGAG